MMNQRPNFPLAGLLCLLLVACGDEASPQDLVPDARGWGMAAAAIVLAPIDQAGARRTSMRITRPGRPDLPPASVDAALARNPQIGLVDLVDAITRGHKGTVGLDRGGGQGWSAEIEPASGA